MNSLTSPDWQDYLSVTDDVLPWLQMTSQNIQPGGSALETNLKLLTSAACWWAQDEYGRPIAPTEFTRRFDGWSGWNGAYLELPYYPVLDISSVVEYWGASGSHTLTESTPTNQVDGYQIERLTGRLTRVFPGNIQKPWFPGSRNVEVSWTAGFNPVPPQIRLGTLELIAEWWRNTQQQDAIRAPGITGPNEYDPADAREPFGGVPPRIRSMFNTLSQVGIG